MKSLSDIQKELIFSYCMGVADEEESGLAKDLIGQSEEARKLAESFDYTLEPLNSIENEVCPDDLVERTMTRLRNQSESSQTNLETLLANEKAKTAPNRNWIWLNFARIVAAAAVIIFAAGVIIAPLRHARHKSWQQVCQAQLGSISSGLSNFIADHDGELPQVDSKEGSPWWKVGYQGQENHSNTRHVWLLVKQGYVEPEHFVCPGKRQGRALSFDAEEVAHLNDFPSREYITYSFRISCPKAYSERQRQVKILISDMNPLFAKLPNKYDQDFVVKITKELLETNSPNHHKKGQNVLFSDGSTLFISSRHAGISEDDIFTLRDTQVYKGVEFPACQSDAFLAP